MTVENLHDAIGLLPADLITETDEKRQHKAKKVIPFRRIAAFAACFALVLCCGWYASLLFAPKGAGAPAMQFDQTAAPEAPAEAAPMENAVAGEAESPGAEVVPTYAAAEGGSAPDTDESCKDPLTGSEEALTWVETANIGSVNLTAEPQLFLLRSSQEWNDFCVSYGCWDLDALEQSCAVFDFESQDLILVLLKAVSVDASVHFQSLTNQDGAWTLTLTLSPSSGEAVHDRFVLVPIEKNTLPQETALELEILELMVQWGRIDN